MSSEKFLVSIAQSTCTYRVGNRSVPHLQRSKFVTIYNSILKSSNFWRKNSQKPFLEFALPILHYSKSQIFVKKFNFDKTPTFWRVLHPIFWQFFLWNHSCQQLPRVFHTKRSTIFSRNQSWIFGQKMKISNSVSFYNIDQIVI